MFLCSTESVISQLFSRVHISRAAYDNLKGSFKVEPGHGGDRDAFLADYGIETFLVVPTSEESEAATQQSATTTQVVLDQKGQTNGTNSTVQHLLQTLEYSESNGDPDWKPEIPFGNVSLILLLASTASEVSLIIFSWKLVIVEGPK